MTTTHIHQQRMTGIVLLSATAILASFGGVLIKQISWNAMAIAGIRSALALPLLLIVLRRSHVTWSAAQVGAAICYAATLISFVIATKLTTAANAILLQYTAPIYVAMFSVWLLGERVSRFDWLVIIMVVLGIALFFLDKLTLGNIWGNITAIVCGIFYAFFILLMRKQKNSFPLGSVVLGHFLTALVCVPFMFDSLPDAYGWGCLILMGIFQLGLASLLLAVAIKRVTALEGILIPTTETILNPLWVFIFVGEEPGRWALLGGAVVIGSIVVRSFKVTHGNLVDTVPPGVEGCSDAK